MQRITATIERYHCYGTPHHRQRLTYRGNTVHWREGIASVYADAVCYGHETIGAMIEHARRQGFTHVRFAGDWARFTVRKTMRIPSTPYVFPYGVG